MKKLYDKVMQLKLMQTLMKKTFFQKVLSYEFIIYVVFGMLTTLVNFVISFICNKIFGYGVIKDNPDIKLKREEKDIEEIYSTQRKILQNCSKYLKKGGFLYYSTCSVFKSENEKVCIDFLNENNDFEAVEAGSELGHKQMKVGVSFLPNLSYGAGFYFCKFKKV